ncbi:uncharacterized protein TM35_000521180 [Trypanosoma theileri]|uniref:Mucin-like glycoprotein n=1 Tax=Trypanosoma theileri TaxID=67003 RepID=A0A1X0NGR8_9TRYP|nr:uncharacterized protein TM35_000521180 [Trypanosoma theileri]ORC83974.1 hypothetical protein TM35_000521180 [Trypanosoma theileri]
MMMMMRRVMCVLAVVLCCACGYTMAAAAAVDNDSPSGRGVSRGAVEVSCGAGGALRVRPAAESEWLTCGAGSRVSACGKYADLCRQRTTRTATTTTTIATTTITAGQPKAVMAVHGGITEWDYFLRTAIYDKECPGKPKGEKSNGMDCGDWNEYKKSEGVAARPPDSRMAKPLEQKPSASHERAGELDQEQLESPLEEGSPRATTLQITSADPDTEHQPAKSKPAVTQPNKPESGEAEAGMNAESTSRTERGTSSSTEGNQGKTSNPTDNSATSAGNPNQQVSPATVNATAPSESQETNSTTPPSPENTITEAPTTTPSPVPVPNSDINTIASTVKNRPNVDSSLASVWMRTAAPLLIVAVFFSFTVY